MREKDRVIKPKWRWYFSPFKRTQMVNGKWFIGWGQHQFFWFLILTPWFRFGRGV